MPSADKKRKQKKVPANAGAVVIEGQDNSAYASAAGTSNDLIVGADEHNATDEASAKRRRVSAKELFRERKEAKLSKTRLKKLAAVAVRKQKKQTQASLFEQLAQYQLDPAASQGLLVSTSRAQTKISNRELPSAEAVTEQGGKLRGCSARHVKTTIHNRPVEQEGYYETGSSSSGESGDEENDDDQPMDVLNEVTETAPPPVDKAKETHAVADLNEKAGTEESSQPQAPKEKRAVAQKERPPTVLKPALVSRSEDVEKQRSLLPIYAEEQVIVEAINENQVIRIRALEDELSQAVILCGETGSGKTTQVPQFLFEAGYCSSGRLIGITEPRRVAAVAMARRVGEELGMDDVVSYQIRFEGTRTDQTRILFMTDGVLMKEMERDLMLRKYSVIIIDEAHERSMYSDVLLGLLSRVVPARARSGDPLKLIIMSATLRLDDFLHARLFPTVSPRVLSVDARQFPVTVHFARRTPKDYMKAAMRRVCHIHEEQPLNGAVLVFVSGQREVHTLIKRLSERYPQKRATTQKQPVDEEKEAMRKRRQIRLEDFTEEKERKMLERQQKAEADEEEEDKWRQMDDADAASDYDLGSDDESDGNEEGADGEEAEEDDILARRAPVNSAPLLCLPLYSMLSAQLQRRVFAPPPAGTRLCVVATNVAETSLTLPGVRYVVDTGFEKRRQHDPVTGVSRFVVQRCSQASAEQRAGRAGRTGPGHAYRLYSSAVFSDSSQFAPPDILCKPVEQLVLALKAMNIVKVRNFPFPSPPAADALAAAEERLIRLGALAKASTRGRGNKEAEFKVTSLGRTLAAFPLAPHFAKTLAVADQHEGLLAYAVLLVAILSVREPLISVASLRGADAADTKRVMADALRQRRLWAGPRGSSERALGDFGVLLNAILQASKDQMDEQACSRLGIRWTAVREVRRLRAQLTNLVNSTCQPRHPLAVDPDLPPPSPSVALALRQCLIVGMAENVARRVPDDERAAEGVVATGRNKVIYRAAAFKQPLVVDAESVLFSDQPDWLVFLQAVDLSQMTEPSSAGDTNSTAQRPLTMQTVMDIHPDWLARLAPGHCSFGGQNTPRADADFVDVRYDAASDQMQHSLEAFFGPLRWSLGPVRRELPHDIRRYRWFAQSLLNGDVFPVLAKYKGKLLAQPHTMTKSWARLQTRTESLLNELINHEACSRRRLVELWTTAETKCVLLEEYLDWVPESLHDQIRLEWPPLEDE